MESQMKWIDGKVHNLRGLILDLFLPAARDGLLNAGVDEAQVTYYIDEVLARRVQTGMTGAAWQRAFIGKYGPQFQDMTRVYHAYQMENTPIHEWTV
jgi:hypothetical protein